MVSIGVWVLYWKTLRFFEKIPIEVGPVPKDFEFFYKNPFRSVGAVLGGDFEFFRKKCLWGVGIFPVLCSKKTLNNVFFSSSFLSIGLENDLKCNTKWRRDVSSNWIFAVIVLENVLIMKIKMMARWILKLNFEGVYTFVQKCFLKTYEWNNEIFSFSFLWLVLENVL